MKNRLTVLLLVAAAMSSVWAQEAPAKDKPFDVSQVIAPHVAKLGTPKLRPEIVVTKMAIATPSAIARDHVRTGFALVHAHWDFEAYRHFAAALKADPDCLMAYAGICLSLAHDFHADVSYRRRAIDRITDLINADEKAMKQKKNPRYPEIERGFTYATAILLSNNPRAAGEMFRKMGKSYPDFLQARLLGALILRGGYDVLGNPTEAQEVSVKEAVSMLKKHPNNPMVASFWLAMNAETPNEAMNLYRDALPYARRLVKNHPSIPSWQYFLGHYEWRCGNYLLAERAFAESARLYEEWMKEDGVSLNDCPGYIKAKCYLANSHYQRGRFEDAIQVAKSLRSLKLDPKRVQSEGNQVLMWRGYTLPARLYFAHGAEGDMNRALKSLPSADELKVFVTDKKFPTLVGAYIDSLRVYAGVRKALEKKDLKGATVLHKQTFRGYIGAMAKVASGALRAPDHAHFLRAGSSLAVYDKELDGLVAMIQPKGQRHVAGNWFRSARDKQYIPTQMMPTSVIQPMENRLGDFYASSGNYAKAYEAYSAGNQRFPNNMASLRSMMKALEKQGKSKEAGIVRKHIEAIKP